MRSDYLNKNSQISNLSLKVKKVTASLTLSDNDSGAIILVNPTATTLITLPTIATGASTDVESGWHCKVIITEDAAVTAASFYGVYFCVRFRNSYEITLFLLFIE